MSAATVFRPVLSYFVRSPQLRLPAAAVEIGRAAAESSDGADTDVLVVGAGLAGCIAAHALVAQGFTVRLIEAGVSTRPRTGWLRALFDRFRLRVLRVKDRNLPDHWDEPILFSDEPAGLLRERDAVLGRGLGGSSILYSAALGRMRRADFETDRRGPAGETPLPNAWPIPFDEFRRYYRRAEALLRVVGERDPLDPDDDSEPKAPPPLSERDESVRAVLAANGLSPFRLRVGFDYRPGCAECLGRRCPIGCKADGASRALDLARIFDGLRLETGLTVRSIAPCPGGFETVVLDEAGRAGVRRAARVVLAAGALNTPLVLARSSRLWRSGTAPAMLGRGLMFHFSEIFVVRTRRGLRRSNVRKTLALRDAYAAGLGEIQSIGADLSTGMIMTAFRNAARRRLPQPLTGLVELMRPAAWAIVRVVGPAPIFCSISEDLPYAHNKVWEEPRGGGAVRGRPGRIAVRYFQPAGYLEVLGRARQTIREMFAPLPVFFPVRRVAPNLGHPMGTCRMGTDPALSVVDPDGRLWDNPNVYVADASVFPSSSGVGPSLTVAAFAIRVADRIAAARSAAEAQTVLATLSL